MKVERIVVKRCATIALPPEGIWVAGDIVDHLQNPVDITHLKYVKLRGAAGLRTLFPDHLNSLRLHGSAVIGVYVAGQGLCPNGALAVTPAACLPLQKCLCSRTRCEPCGSAAQTSLAWPAFLCAQATTDSSLSPGKPGGKLLILSHRRLSLAPLAPPFWLRLVLPGA